LIRRRSFGLGTIKPIAMDVERSRGRAG